MAVYKLTRSVIFTIRYCPILCDCLANYAYFPTLFYDFDGTSVLMDKPHVDLLLLSFHVLILICFDSVLMRVVAAHTCCILPLFSSSSSSMYPLNSN